ncbi:MAG: hypothetical protein ACTHJ2_09480 [Candidatus Nitrosocosmicus sp.]
MIAKWRRATTNEELKKLEAIRDASQAFVKAFNPWPKQYYIVPDEYFDLQRALIAYENGASE